MGRPSSFADEAVYAAVARSLVEAGEVRLQAVTKAASLSTGSLYHRFGSREGLMAEAWIDAVEAFQVKFLAALAMPSDVPGLPAALATLRFCRNAPDRAALLVSAREREMMSDKAPDALHARLAAANRKARDALSGFAEAQGLPLERVRLALIGLPLGAVRLYLPKAPLPELIEQDIAKAASALLKQA